MTVRAEEVLVVDRADWFGGDWPQGFAALPPSEHAGFLLRAQSLSRFVPREEAERNPAWKQWIPYCVLRVTSAAGTPEGVFRVQRTQGQTEGRLHGLWSIGLGGHVERADAAAARGTPPSAERFFERALLRELREELDFGAVEPGEPRFLGLLNDDATAVGQVHAGLVYVLDLPLGLPRARDTVRVRETSKMRGGFGSLVEFRDLWQDRARFESWSQFLVRAGVVGPTGASV